MTTFEDILTKARDLLGTVKDKTGEIVDKTKLKMDIVDVEKRLAATFEGIGRLIYEAETTGEDITDIKAAAFDTIGELQTELTKLQNRLYDTEGVFCCEACGTPNEKDAVYCKKCGKAL